MEAVILAGGLGTRLRPVVHDLPKCMVPIAHRPFLSLILDQLETAGFSHVVLSVGHLREKIVEHFGDSYNNLKISYAVEESPLGTGGGIRLAMKQLKGDLAFILNGDTLFMADLKEMYRQYLSGKFKALLALRKMNDTCRYGSVNFNTDLRITQFLEKQESLGAGYINGGIYLIDKFYYLDHTPDGAFSIEKEFFPSAVTDGVLGAFPSDSYFIDIGIPEDYERAQQELV